MAAMTSPPGVNRETKNPYERRLWVVAGVLLVGSCIALAGSHVILVTRFSGWSGNEPPGDIQIAQLLSAFAPHTLTGGIILAGMALAVGALRFDRRLYATGGVPVPSAAVTDDSASAGHAPIASQAVDHTPYMRPQGGTQR